MKMGQIAIGKLKESKTMKEMKEALVEIFEGLDVDVENIAYDVVKEALKTRAQPKEGEEAEEAEEAEESGTSVKP